MANSFPEHAASIPQPLGFATIAVLLACFTGSIPVNAQEMPRLQPDVPISIDAESSEFDYSTSRLLFRKLRMEQGDLRIESDLAETDKLDFTSGLWIFTGNVKLKTATAILQGDRAQLTFKDHQLSDALLTGQPARFEQKIDGSEKINTGEASQISYQRASQILKLKQSAQFTDGSNQVSGDQIVYDLTARRLTADSGESGPVKILIETPNQLKEKIKSP